MTQTRPTCLMHGSIVDGTGSSARPGHVLISGDRIAAVMGPNESVPDEAERVDVSGLVVSPGLIDTHSHADNVPFLPEGDASKIEQGVTTEVVGNCGFSLAPTNPEHDRDLTMLLGRIFPPMQTPWRSYGEFLRYADAGGYVTNYVPLVGHNVLRVAAFGSLARAPEPDELQLMGRLLDQALEDGAFGLSSGLIYPPGVFCEPDELQYLTARLGSERIYATHMRNESSHVSDSVREAVTTAGKSGCRLHVSHLKIAHRAQWTQMASVLEQLDRARVDGVHVTQDAYPYAAGSTMLTALLPPWFHDGGSTAVLERLASPESLGRAERDLADPDAGFENFVLAAGWENIVVSSTASHRYEGQSITSIAKQLGQEPFEAFVHVLREERLAATMVMHAMHDDDVGTVLAHSQTAIGSDSLPPGVGGKPHPRTFGTFPRMLGPVVRDDQVVSLPEAVRRMTSWPAQIFGLTGRGTVGAGQVADLLCFDPEAVADRATYAEPTLAPTGIHRVYQRGRLAVDDGTWLGHRHGSRLTPS